MGLEVPAAGGAVGGLVVPEASGGGGGDTPGPTLLGTIDFRALGDHTYTSAGAKTADGFSFTLTGASAGNEVEIEEGVGLRVNTGAADISLDFDPLTHLGVAAWSSVPVIGMKVKLDDGTTTASDVISLAVGTDANNFAAIQRRHAVVRSAIKISSSFSPNVDFSVAAATDVQMLSALVCYHVIQGLYSTSEVTTDPTTLTPAQANSSSVITSGALDGNFGRIFFGAARGKNIEYVEFWRHN